MVAASPLLRRTYNAIFKRTSTFVAAIMVGAFLFERTVDPLLDGFWERKNQGKLWDHIKSKYEENGQN